MSDKIPTESYVWDLNNPNVPESVLSTPSPITNISYNPKLTDQIAGGCMNGLVAIWDVKKGKDPVMVSPVEMSHYDPITHINFLSMKLGNELVTTSTDGRVLWWDTRKFDKPYESLSLVESMQSGENKGDRVVGGTVFEYNTEAGPNKFLVGTEQGTILTANKKPKKAVEITSRYGLEGGRHLGPVYSISRSIPNNRYFLSVGDWSVNVSFIFILFYFYLNSIIIVLYPNPNFFNTRNF
jgi:dynein intermediate chain 2